MRRAGYDGASGKLGEIREAKDFMLYVTELVEVAVYLRARFEDSKDGGRESISPSRGFEAGRVTCVARTEPQSSDRPSPR